MWRNNVKTGYFCIFSKKRGSPKLDMPNMDTKAKVRAFLPYLRATKNAYPEILRRYIFSRLISGIFVGLSQGLDRGIIVGFLAGLIDAIRFKRDGNLQSVKNKNFWKVAGYILVFWLSSGLFTGLVKGVMIGITMWLNPIPSTKFNDALEAGLTFAPAFGLGDGFIIALIFGVRSIKQNLRNDIQTFETFDFSWTRAVKGTILGLISGVLGAGIVGMFSLLVSEIFARNRGSVESLSGYGFLADIITWGSLLGFILYGMRFGTIGLLGGLIIGGVSSKVIEIKAFPNQGIQLSKRNAVFVGGIAFLLGWLILGISFGSFLALTSIAWFGGLDVIQHFVLRFMLFRNKYAPLKYSLFLDHCVDLIFLRRVGGGYIFVHRLLMEHFAEMYVETPTSKGN
jgi:hypothetical protein